MSTILRWIDDRTGLVDGLRQFAGAKIPAETRGQTIWPAAILFAFVVEAITGVILWMYYSPGAQSAWESVYWIQYEVAGGWLVRGMHYYAGQVLLVLIGLYVLHMLAAGTYRAPREFAFWIAVLMGVVTLALLLTGDLMAWTQGGSKSTEVRTSYLTLIPWIGADLQKVAVGGAAFGHLTLTRFLALHAGVFSAVFGLLIYLHARFSRRADASGAAAGEPMVPYWPSRGVWGAVACLVVLAVILGLVGHRAWVEDRAGQRPGDYLGVELGPPADPTVPYEAARPDWYFVCLYQLANSFPAGSIGPVNLEILPIFVIPGLLVLFFLAMPWIAKWRGGSGYNFVGTALVFLASLVLTVVFRRKNAGQVLAKLRGGHALNLLATAVLLVAAVVLTSISKVKDAADPGYQAAVAAGLADAERVKELAQAPQGIPVSGAVTLLRNDPKTQGPRLFAQNCASCHACTDSAGEGIVAENCSAPNLYDFASREWIAGLFDPAQIDGPKYFGNTAFKDAKKSRMVKFVKNTLPKMAGDLGISKQELKQEIEKMISALAEEAQGAPLAGAEAKKAVAARVQLLGDLTCTDCHRFHDQGALGAAPELTGYGSQEWLTRIISDPAHQRFYGDRNDRMPAYAKTPEQPENNILSARQLEMLVHWLRGQWYEPKPDGP